MRGRFTPRRQREAIGCMQLFKREKYLRKIRPFYDAADIIKVVTGVRRCGKSSLMTTIADELREKGVPDSNLIWLDLDARGYRRIKTADQLEALIDEKTRVKGLKYVFIDEIQNVTGFEEILNAFRIEGEISFFITGSNSYLLSGELVTKLTGRYLEFELFTLGFDEYEAFKEFYRKPIDPNPLVELANYVQEGGFPRAFFLNDLVEKRTYVEGVIREIFEKDVRRRVKIKDLSSFEAVRNYVVNNYGATTSVNGLHQALRNNGLAIGRSTLARYLQILIDAKILYECYRFDMKSRRSLAGEKKYYLADLSFYFALNTDNRINYGPALENLVYVYARSMNYSVSVGRVGKLECDFILRNQELGYAYVQVSYTIMISRQTEDREYKPLESSPDNYPKYLMTTDALLQKRNGIRHVNLIEFLKQGQTF